MEKIENEKEARFKIEREATYNHPYCVYSRGKGGDWTFRIGFSTEEYAEAWIDTQSKKIPEPELIGYYK